MTLYKQLLTWMLAFFFILITSVFFVEFRTTRNFLENQQTAEINNTINSMGLALSPYLEAHDKVAAESVINALFDGGFYSEVKLTMLDDQGIILRQYPTQIEGVPDWFVALDLFSSITDERILTSGWLQLAEVKITGHPGFAYQQLWKATVQLVSGFAVMFLVSAVIMALLLNYSLKPLTLIARRADEIAKNQFGQPLPVPPTKDLKTVVHAINHMSTQLEVYFKEQAKEADKLRERAYQDPVSGLGNRSYFISQLESWLAESSTGGMALLKVDLITECYDNQGYEAGDKMVAALAQGLLATVNRTEVTLARLSQAEFALLAPNVSASELRAIGLSMLRIISELQADPMGEATLHASVGLVMNHQGLNVGMMLAQADNALTRAAQNPTQPIALIEQQHSGVSLGKQQWKALLLEAIADDLFSFKFQKAAKQNGQILHHEVFAAIEKEGQYYSAGQFLGAIEQLDIGDTLDRYVIKQMIDRLKQEPTLGPLTVNLTQSSITNASFIRWLGSLMENNRELSSRIMFELPEAAFVRNPDHIALLCGTIHQHQFRFGVDNYGRHFRSLDYLNEFRPDYVKIDFAYTNELEDETKTSVLASISRTAHNLNITTIATRVETESQLNILSESFVSGFQGFIFDQQKSTEKQS
ncbi:EAL domain-containing protein [Photobacterium atrarenae]|uniref:EAL domain-containing protein n=1 Tax=Photobacterium atrarenae TaxID=865757 RepID=A0ABY5GIL7_9GAMM|nr:EAL domain-containing protein [Photobacterium atrarenae]UTV28630.1 EAL domain-containing protein [Photobacterium atrarenae]